MQNFRRYMNWVVPTAGIMLWASLPLPTPLQRPIKLESPLNKPAPPRPAVQPRVKVDQPSLLQASSPTSRAEIENQLRQTQRDLSRILREEGVELSALAQHTNEMGLIESSAGISERVVGTFIKLHQQIRSLQIIVAEEDGKGPEYFAAPPSKVASPQVAQHALHLELAQQTPMVSRFVEKIAMAPKIQDQDIHEVAQLCVRSWECIEKAAYTWIKSNHLLNPRQLALVSSHRKGDRHQGTLSTENDSESFLASYQEVRRSQRGAVVPIDAELADPHYNFVVNHAARAYIAPWLRARYSSVFWITESNSLSKEQIQAVWKEAIETSAVIDYFAFTHEEDGVTYLRYSEGLPWKNDQLRLVYTEGCGSASSLTFSLPLSDFGAAMIVGHRGTSASPLFTFPFIRSWTYGNSVLKAVQDGWKAGKKMAERIDFVSSERLTSRDWKNLKDLIDQSEMGIGWTAELPPAKLTINQSATLERETEEQRTFFLSYIENFGKDVKSTVFQKKPTETVLP